MSNEEYRVYYEYFILNKPSFPFIFHDQRETEYKFDSKEWEEFKPVADRLKYKNIGYLKALKKEYFKIQMNDIINNKEGEEK